jgi:peptidoglycan/LPS O-acetylase OafA/YrhL
MNTSNSDEIRALTGLRGVAASMVVSYHCFSQLVPVAWLRAALSHGYIWVDCFFVLSGFIMALSFPLPPGRGLIPRFGGFLLRRIARIWPLYLVCSLAGFVQTQTGQSVFTNFRYHAPGELLLANLVMAQNLAWAVPWGPHGWGGSANFAAWSISTEWTAYLAYPMLYAVTLGSRRIAMLAALIAAGALLWVAFTPLPGVIWRHGPMDVFDGNHAAATLRCMAEFTLGLLAYRVRDHRAVRAVLRNRAAAAVLFAAIVALLAWPASDLLIVALFPPLILSLLQERAPCAAVLSRGIVYRLGVWSYAIYMVHGLFLISAAHIWVVRRWPAKLPQTLISLAAILLLALLAHYGVERPCRRWLRHWAGGKPDRRGQGGWRSIKPAI